MMDHPIHLSGLIWAPGVACWEEAFVKFGHLWASFPLMREDNKTCLVPIGIQESCLLSIHSVSKLPSIFNIGCYLLFFRWVSDRCQKNIRFYKHHIKSDNNQMCSDIQSDDWNENCNFIVVTFEKTNNFVFYICLHFT